MTTQPNENKQEQAVVNLLAAIRDTNWAVQREMFGHDAKRLKVKYDACLREGFTEQQAMYFCTQEWK